MTLPFCDICGKAAVPWPSVTIPFPEKAWRGLITTPGSISPTDGTWTPKLNLDVVFHLDEFKDQRPRHPADLCASCMAMAIRKMLDEVTEEKK